MSKILLIEDDVVLRENTAELLELSNYEVITANNGKSGLEIAKNNIPDIIVCDIMMPELDGYGVLESLAKNENTKYIPFIFLSAMTERKDVRKGMDLGADDYITKPFEEDELISAIESRLAKAEILKDARRNIEKINIEDTKNRLGTFDDLSKYFDSHGKRFQFTSGKIIYREGNNSNTIYLIKNGVVKNHKLDELGKELIIGLYKENDLFGYSSFTENIPYRESATALTNTELIGISKQKLKDVLDNNHNLTMNLIEVLTEDLSEVKEQLLEMAYGSVSRKTAATILKFAEKLNKEPHEPIKISRNDLASIAGIATETLIRTLSNFKKEGIIDIEGRNIKIIDLDKLHQMN